MEREQLSDIFKKAKECNELLRTVNTGLRAEYYEPEIKHIDELEKYLTSDDNEYKEIDHETIQQSLDGLHDDLERWISSFEQNFRMDRENVRVCK